MSAGAWWPSGEPSERARVSLICFPFAGGGASLFRTWRRSLLPEIDVCPVQLPGRETRLRESPFRRMDPLAEALREGLRPWLSRPFALFGHSMGALIAYELAHGVLSEGGGAPMHLFVSGARAPHLFHGDGLSEDGGGAEAGVSPATGTPVHGGDARADDGPAGSGTEGIARAIGATRAGAEGEATSPAPGRRRRRVLHALSYEAFVAALRDLDGTPEEVLAHPELMELLLPVLRCDFELCETYEYRDRAPLPCPITAFGGAEDRQVSREELDGWKVQTRAGFEARLLPGNHFFLGPQSSWILQRVRETLSAFLEPGRSAVER